MTRSIGRTERRVVLAIFVTAIVPLLTAMWLGGELITRISQTAFQPELGQHLDRALGLYADLVRSMKASMRHQAAAIAEQHPLRTAAAAEDRDAAQARLDAALGAHDNLLRLSIDTADGDPWLSRDNGRALNAGTERAFTVVHPLGDDPEVAPQLTAVFAADTQRLDEMAAAQELTQSYNALVRDHRQQYVEQPYLRVMATVLGLTMLLAIISGMLVMRPVTRRINRLAAATGPVADGDLSVRVEVEGRDEIADLAHAFNQMLERLGRSRARIEFLNRIGEWQNMARRLAHEIKNPLTPIQLAVEECHRRYPGDDARYRELLATTLDIVVEEVASLRRLVGEFSEFARLPRADLRHGDLREFLLDQRQRLERNEAGIKGGVRLVFDVGDTPMPVALDRTMLYRVLENLVRNAADAIAERGEGGQVRVRARREGDHFCLDVDDDGPGIDETVRPNVFDPYVTTKGDGTGLGLTIVKKVVIDHGGQIDVDTSSLGGARFRIRLPVLGTSASEAAVLQSRVAPMSG